MCFNLVAQKLVAALRRSLDYWGICTTTDHYNVLGNWGLGMARRFQSSSLIEELARQSKGAGVPGRRDSVSKGTQA